MVFTNTIAFCNIGGQLAQAWKYYLHNKDSLKTRCNGFLTNNGVKKFRNFPDKTKVIMRRILYEPAPALAYYYLSVREENTALMRLPVNAVRREKALEKNIENRILLWLVVKSRIIQPTYVIP